MMAALIVALAGGCRAHEDTGGTEATDRDGDGFDAPADCDDADAAVSPAATESCNGIDDDCNGSVDEGVSYTDADADGYGDASAPRDGLCVGEGVSALSGDCDDTDPLAYPGATEECDGSDTDCDGERTTCWLEDTAQWTFMELQMDHEDGKVVSLRGDVDGDGFADVLIGGGGGGYDWTTNEAEGQVHLFKGGGLGFAGAYLLEYADWTLVGGEGSRAAGGRYSNNGSGSAGLRVGPVSRELINL